MSEERVERRLAAILAADVAGYSRLMGEDEAGTLARLRALRRDLINPRIADHRGRIVKTTGDGILIEFPSVVEAVACAVAVQREMAKRNLTVARDQRIEFRVGINSGDVIVEDDDIHGDGVNVAARLEALAEPGSICISGIVHDQVQGRLEIVFEDTGEQSLKNIARAVRVYRVRLDEAIAAADTPVPMTPTPELPDKPSIAVLPFQNMSGDPDQEYFADGMVEEITTALSRICWLFVIARNSSFTYKGQAVDVKQVGRELGVRYVLEGSVRKGENRVRIATQLIDATTGAHLWADRFDGALGDVFELQDRVATSVAGVIEPALQAAEIRRLVEQQTKDVTAYDFYLRALARCATFEKAGNREALSLLERAIERDPDYGLALSLAALCRTFLAMCGWIEDQQTNRLKAVDLARRALQVAGDDPGALVSAAFTLAYSGENIGAMLKIIDRALALNPSFARGWHLSGVLHQWAGQFDLAIEHVETGLRLSPRERIGMTSTTIGAAHMFARRFDKAEQILLIAVQEDPLYPPAYRSLAACYAHTGQLDKAREIIRRLRTITSAVVPSYVHYQNPEHREFFLSALRLAAGEIG